MLCLTLPARICQCPDSARSQAKPGADALGMGGCRGRSSGVAECCGAVTVAWTRPMEDRPEIGRMTVPAHLSLLVKTRRPGSHHQHIFDQSFHNLSAAPSRQPTNSSNQSGLRPAPTPSGSPEVMCTYIVSASPNSTRPGGDCGRVPPFSLFGSI